MKRSSSRLTQAGLSALLVLLLAAHVAGLIAIAPMQRAEAWLYDTGLRLTALVSIPSPFQSAMKASPN